ncbi:MAG: NAD(P)-dependent alcohol dehydrogenase [Saprospiraceae bacterium]|nr:NAD(P)-dependent alcohol dehydrogenase [Saprospiraceae bacterium]
MKAVICTAYGTPEVLQMQTIDKPIPKSNEVLIKVQATTVTVADFRIRSFTVPRSMWLPVRLALGLFKPRQGILGLELSGEIEAVGKEVNTYKVGDEVFGSSMDKWGGYAEYVCLPASSILGHKPATVSHTEAAAITIGAHTALHFLRKAEVKPGQKVLIYGASGSVGTYAVQLAKLFGAEVTSVSSAKNHPLLESLGADKTLDYTDTYFRDKLERYDLIFDAVAKLPFSVAVKHLRPKGAYLNIASPLPSLSMLWTRLSSQKRIIMANSPKITAEEMTYLTQLVEEDKLKIVMDRTYPLEEIQAAHAYVGLGHKVGNVSITIN